MNVINLQKIWRFDDVKQTVEINLIIITNISRLSDNNKKNEAWIPGSLKVSHSHIAGSN